MKSVRVFVARLLCIAISLAIVLNSGTLAWLWLRSQAEVYDWGTATQGRRVTRKQALSVSHKTKLLFSFGCSKFAMCRSRCITIVTVMNRHH